VVIETILIILLFLTIALIIILIWSIFGKKEDIQNEIKNVFNNLGFDNKLVKSRSILMKSEKIINN